MNNKVRVFQLTDIHLFATPNGELLKLKTLDSFRAVLKIFRQAWETEEADVILVTGDLSQDDSEQSYQLVMEELQDFNCPILWTPGNHDEPRLMQKLLIKHPFNTEKHIDLNDWQIILLNSQLPGKVAGFLDAGELDFLETQLHSNTKNTLVVMHHQALPVGCIWLDNIGLLNRDDFWKIIDKFTQVKGVLCGHVHQANHQTRKNINFMTTPSTSVQFKPQVVDFALDAIMPGFRILELEHDGKITTEVLRIPYDSKYLPDLNSKGY